MEAGAGRERMAAGRRSAAFDLAPRPVMVTVAARKLLGRCDSSAEQKHGANCNREAWFVHGIHGSTNPKDSHLRSRSMNQCSNQRRVDARQPPRRSCEAVQVQKVLKPRR